MCVCIWLTILLHIMNVRVIKVFLPNARKQRVKSLFEWFSKVTVEVSINYGIKSGVKVPNPEENGDEYVGAWTQLWAANWCNYIPITREWETAGITRNFRALTKGRMEANKEETHLRGERKSQLASHEIGKLNINKDTCLTWSLFIQTPVNYERDNSRSLSWKRHI